MNTPPESGHVAPNAPPEAGGFAALAPLLLDVDAHAAADDTPTTPLCAAGSRPVSTPRVDVTLARGTVLRSRYALEQVIGSGGSSIVYRARDLQQGVPPSGQDPSSGLVAIKLLRREHSADPQARARLTREFRQMRRLAHAGIARVFELHCDSDMCFISMELVAGRTVNEWLQAGSSYQEALRIIRGCCEALQYAHSLDVLHGDLKPTNVLVGANSAVKLIDFGSSPDVGEQAAERADEGAAATPLFASPQVLAGQAPEGRDDVFSLACLSYGILSRGRHPFGGRPSFEGNRAKSAPTYVRTIPPELFKVIESGLSADRERRPASVAQFLSELNVAERRRRAAVILDQRHERHERRAKRSATATPVATHSGVAGTRGAPRRIAPLSRLVPLAFAIAAIGVLARVHAQRGMQADVQPPSEVAVSAPAAPVQTKADVLPEQSATPQSAGVVSFEAHTLRVSAAQTLVAIPVKREPASNGRAAFVWRVEGGTATPGVDFPRIAPQRVRFTDGQAVRTLFIPLINTGAPRMPAGPRTFTVALQPVAGGPKLGSIARVTVAIDSSPAPRRAPVYQARTAE